jgi:polyisoprenoid-binding protein YceI
VALELGEEASVTSSGAAVREASAGSFREKPQRSAVIYGGTRTMRGETFGMTTPNGAERVTLVPPGTWEVDPARSTVGFAVRHLKVTKVHGRLCEVTGVVRCDSEGVASIDGSVKVASIDTGDHRRDARLCAEDFFDVERHPTIALTAVSPPVAPGDTPTVRGTMTVRGASRPLKLQVDAPASPVDGNGDLRIRANGVVSRRDFGLEWDSAFAAGGVVIDDRVGLRLDIVMVHPTPSTGD